ncbi:MAG: substrate-binding domain-containing protein [Acidimicrobiales bacterium]
MGEENRASSLDRRRFLQLLGVAGAGVALGACSSATSPVGSATTTAPPAGGFPLGAASKAKTKPVTVTFWNSMTENNLLTLQSLTKQFNASQSDVLVKLVNQNSYTDTLTAYTAAAGSHTLPDLVQMENVDLQVMVDSQTVVPAGDAVAAEAASASETVASWYSKLSLLPSALDYFSISGTQWAMPFNESTQVLYYDQVAFEKAGLDPSSPPTTLDEYKSACEAIVSKNVAKFGTSLKLTSSNFELWMAQAGSDLVNNGNGRTARATKVSFNDSAGQSLFAFYSEMLSSKLAQATSGTGSGDFDNLLAIASGSAPMSIDTSAALGTVLATLPKLRKSLKLGLGPLPAPPGPGGVPYGGAGLYMVKDSPDERQDGAWQFIKFLLGAGPMAIWSVGSGYIPITSAALDVTSLKAAWARVPQYKVAYEQVETTKSSTATGGAVAGALAQIETNILNGITSVSSGTAPNKALSEIAYESDTALSSYNSRL